MKKNRIFTSALAAVVLLAAGCSDDLEDSGNGTGNGELNGPQTYMKVSVNPGVVTKATGGEEGDIPDGEIGEKDEYTVKDVTVILFKDKGVTTGTAPTAFTATSELVAAGYGQIPGDMADDPEKWHNRVATVQMEVTQKEEQFDGKTYGIIAVANLGATAGEELVAKVVGTDATVKNGADLANLLQAKYRETGFIMSTHNDQYQNGTKILDVVKLEASKSPENAPTASVHVERLAAKVRITETDAQGVSDFIYPIKEDDGQGGAQEVAKVRLDEVAIVNQLTSGSFLLKRVTSNTDAPAYGSIPEKFEGHDSYLGNELADETDNTTTGINYVIDPWTRSKTVTDGMDWTNLNIGSTEGVTEIENLSYNNRFYGTDFGTMWTSLTDKVALAGNTALTKATSEKLHLAYTMENTTADNMSKNGFSTGALFKATYIPKYLSMQTTEESKKVVKPVEVTNFNTDDAQTALTYDNIEGNSKISLDFYLYLGNAYDSYATIFNEHAWGVQADLDDVAGATIYNYASFLSTTTDGETLTINKIKKKEFFKSLLGKSQDPMGYIAYLKSTVNGSEDGLTEEEINEIADEVTFTTEDAIDTYINSKKTDKESLMNKNITEFKDCVCYYPYWIRHADNNSTDMGVMEFAIVRNNIYDLEVSGISGYGYADAEQPVPGQDDEFERFFFNVNILVKNWVVRSNSDIIL